MANFLKKMFDFNIDEKHEEKLEVKEKKATKVDTISTEKVKKASVINFEDKKINLVQEDANIDYQMVVYKPYDLYDCTKIGDWISKDVIIILNLDDVDTKLAQRVIDFVSGSLYVKGARLYEIARNVQLCVPAKINLKIDDPKYSDTNSFYEDRIGSGDVEEIKPKYYE